MLAGEAQVEFLEKEVGTCALLFKQLVEFESPRVLIQEVQSSTLIVQDDGAGSDHFVDEYFGRSVLLFRDDSGFMTHLKALIGEDLPLGPKEQLV